MSAFTRDINGNVWIGLPPAHLRPPRRERPGVFHVALPQPWAWALVHHGLRHLFFTEEVAPGRHSPLHPPDGVVGCLLAVYVAPEYDTAAPAWIRRATGLEAPPAEALPTGCYVAMGRIWESEGLCGTLRTHWWAPDGMAAWGVVPWQLEDVVAFEPLPAAPAHHCATVDRELLPELRSRWALARDGLWRPEPVPAPASCSAASTEGVTPEPPLPEHDWDAAPVPPMAENPAQLGLFGEPPTPAAPPSAPFPMPVAAPERPADELGGAASRLRGLLADGAWHSMDDVLRVVGLSAFYRVTVLGRDGCQPEPHQVPVVLRGDGQGGCWYAAWRDECGQV